MCCVFLTSMITIFEKASEFIAKCKKNLIQDITISSVPQQCQYLRFFYKEVMRICK